MKWQFLTEPLISEKQPDELLRRTVSANFSDDDTLKKFIRYYLEMQGINKEQPDNVVYVDGKIVSEYYIDEQSEQICFISYYISASELQNDGDYGNNKSVTCITVPCFSPIPTGHGIATDTPYMIARDV